MLAGATEPSPAPLPALPGAAETAFRFVAPTGLTVPIGGAVKLALTGGCGNVYWGVLDPEGATITADGTLRPRRPGGILAFAEQDGDRRYLHIAATAAHPTATRFGPPAGWTFDGRLRTDEAVHVRTRADQARTGDSDRTMVITTSAELDALWRDQIVDIQAFVPHWGPDKPPSPRPAPPPPAIDFTREAVVALAVTLYGDEADPVLTHLDANGLHIAVPGATGAGITSRRQVLALFRVPTLLPGTPLASHPPIIATPAIDAKTPIHIIRPDPSRPVPPPLPGPGDVTPPPRPPAPTGPGPACPPAWAWDANPRDLSLDVGDAPATTDAQGLPIPAPLLALPVGGALHMVGRSARGPLTWTLVDPARAKLTPDPHGIPMASAPPRPGQPPAAPAVPGMPVGATLVAQAPGAIWVTASAGGAQARALIACTASPAPALAFRFLRGGGTPAADVAAGTHVIANGTAWSAFWDDTFPALAGDAPPVDFAAYAVVAWIDDRIAYGERGEPVLVGIDPVTHEVQIVAPGVESHRALPRHRRAVSLFLTGPLAPSAAVRITTLCGPLD